MIKANELRIGNTVYDRHGNITHIHAGWFYITQDPKRLADYSPIPLSPEILEKCGGEKDDKSIFGGYLFRLKGGEQIRIVHSDTIGWHWPMFGHTAVLVNYLHQFQNLMFSLDGEELNFNLK